MAYDVHAKRSKVAPLQIALMPDISCGGWIDETHTLGLTGV